MEAYAYMEMNRVDDEGMEWAALDGVGERPIASVGGGAAELYPRRENVAEGGALGGRQLDAPDCVRCNDESEAPVAFG